MWVVSRLRPPPLRRHFLVAAVLLGCFVWAMIIVGLIFALIDRGNENPWSITVFGAFVLAIAVLAVRWISGARPSASTMPFPANQASSLAGSAATGEPEPVAAEPAPPVKSRRMLAEPLSPRELEVLHHLAAGGTNTEIATLLFIAPGTVKAHLNHIFRKLEATSRLQAVTHAREADLLE